MIFSETNIIAKRSLSGAESVDLAEGDKLIIDANGVSIVKEKVPKGKKWRVILNVTIEETDA